MMQPLADDPNKCQMTIINELNLKGSLPEYAVKIAGKEKGMEVDRLRTVYSIWKKQFPDETNPNLTEN